MPNIQKKTRKKIQPKKPAYIPVMYRCSADDIDRLDKVARQLGHTRSSLCRFVISNYVTEFKAQV